MTKNLFKDYIKFSTLLHTGTRFYSNVTFLNTHVVLKITPLVIDSHQLKSLRLLLISTSKEYLWLFDLGQMGKQFIKLRTFLFDVLTFITFFNEGNKILNAVGNNNCV